MEDSNQDPFTGMPANLKEAIQAMIQQSVEV
jgi:hypothetical protein